LQPGVNCGFLFIQAAYLSFDPYVLQVISTLAWIMIRTGFYTENDFIQIVALKL
jgi:hypothetical protein